MVFIQNVAAECQQDGYHVVRDRKQSKPSSNRHKRITIGSTVDSSFVIKATSSIYVQSHHANCARIFQPFATSALRATTA